MSKEFTRNVSGSERVDDKHKLCMHGNYSRYTSGRQSLWFGGKLGTLRYLTSDDDDAHISFEIDGTSIVIAYEVAIAMCDIINTLVKDKLISEDAGMQAKIAQLEERCAAEDVVIEAVQITGLNREVADILNSAGK